MSGVSSLSVLMSQHERGGIQDTQRQLSDAKDALDTAEAELEFVESELMIRRDDTTCVPGHICRFSVHKTAQTR